MGAATRAAIGEPEIVVLPSAEEVSRVAAERIAAALVAAAGARGRADWATTGGSTPAAIYRHLAGPALRTVVPWDRVHLWWGDDRYVPYDHPLSNIRLADEVLLGGAHGSAGVPLPASNVHPFPTAEAIGEAKGAAWCAARYAEELRESEIEVAGGWPVFDVLLLGVGPDGHLLSVFPGSAALESTDWTLAIPAPTHVEPHVERVTLNPRVVEAARLVLPVVHGAGKAEILGTILGAERNPARWPAQLARRPGAIWLLDTEAAARL